MRRKKHSEHHGGAWKVAYADFVTAMMALFMVLWICAQDPNIVKSTAEYFTDPKAFLTSHPLSGKSAGILDGASIQSNSGEGSQMSNEALKILQSMAQTFYKSLNLNEQEASKPIDIIVTDDGLRIFLYNRKDPSIFESNTATITSWGQFVIETLSWLLDRQPMKIRIDSITSNQQGAKSWEISLDRSACILKTLQAYNLRNATFELLTGSAQAVGNSASDVFENCERIEISLKLG